MLVPRRQHERVSMQALCGSNSAEEMPSASSEVPINYSYLCLGECLQTIKPSQWMTIPDCGQNSLIAVALPH